MEKEYKRFILFIEEGEETKFYTRDLAGEVINHYTSVRDICIDECIILPVSSRVGQILYFDKTIGEWCVWLNDDDVKYRFSQFILDKVMVIQSSAFEKYKEFNDRDILSKATDRILRLMDCCSYLPVDKRFDSILDMIKEDKQDEKIK